MGRRFDDSLGGGFIRDLNEDHGEQGLFRCNPAAADWRDFLALTKPRVLSLVVFTGLCGLLAAPHAINPVLGFTAILCIALGAGRRGALNQWYEAISTR